MNKGFPPVEKLEREGDIDPLVNFLQKLASDHYLEKIATSWGVKDYEDAVQDCYLSALIHRPVTCTLPCYLKKALRLQLFGDSYYTRYKRRLEWIEEQK